MSKWTVSNKKIMEKMCPVLNTEFFYVFDKGDKFLDDKVLIDDNQIFILLDGVIFNKVEIMEELKKAIWEETVFALYQKEGIEFVKRLRGTFNGIIIDKKNKCLRAFVDQLGKEVFSIIQAI